MLYPFLRNLQVTVAYKGSEKTYSRDTQSFPTLKTYLTTELYFYVILIDSPNLWPQICS